MVAHQLEVIGGAESAGAAAHNGNPFAGGGGVFRGGNYAGVIDSVPLEAADVDGIIDHIPAAAGLAGMLADEGAGGGEGVILADQAHCVGIAALGHQGDIAGDIHPGGAEGHAGHRLVQAACAAAVADMLLVILPVTPDAFEHHIGGFIADGAVSGGDDDAGGFLDEVNGIHGGLAGENLLQHNLQLAEAHAAGDAFAAGLGVAQLEEGGGHIHWAQSRRAGDDTAFQILVEALYNDLGLVGTSDGESVHRYSDAPFVSRIKIYPSGGVGHPFPRKRG